MENRSVSAIELPKLICLCQMHDRDAIDYVVTQFMPLIKKYAGYLAYPDATQDLIVLFLNILGKIPLSKFDPQKKTILVLSYISKAMKNGYIYLSKRNRTTEYYVEDLAPDLAAKSDDLEIVFVRDAIKRLTTLQRRVIILKYYYGYKNSEISRILRISRQAVNQTKQRALNRLKGLLID